MPPRLRKTKGSQARIRLGQLVLPGMEVLTPKKSDLAWQEWEQANALKRRLHARISTGPGV